MPFKAITVTNAIILVNVLIFLFQQLFEDERFFSMIFGLNRLFVDAGLWFQPLSTMFVHASAIHLGMNMVVLFQFGSLIESHKGKFYFSLLYFLGGLTASLISIAFIIYFNLNHNLVGASGAISVLFGWIALLDANQRKGIITALLLISFVPLFMGINIAWYAHIIGFIIGWLAALKLRRNIR